MTTVLLSECYTKEKSFYALDDCEEMIRQWIGYYNGNGKLTVSIKINDLDDDIIDDDIVDGDMEYYK